MPEAVDVTNADHYVWGEVSDGWRLLDSPGLSVIEERVPAGAGEEWHVHDTATQFFYVLEGTAQMQTAEGAVDLEARQGVEVRPGLAHRFFNPGAAETRFLVISTPNTRGDRRPVAVAL
ncbi:cupin domain-containing protein [Microbacterium sp. NPDC090014]|uniref:cupin domain-containing protein n=1 Tax=Microbacterium sp. NPDC090014 TaxID=3364205 RepID=UPI0037F1509C